MSFLVILNYILHAVIAVSSIWASVHLSSVLVSGKYRRSALMGWIRNLCLVIGIFFSLLGIIGLILSMDTTVHLDFLSFPGVSGLFGNILRSPWLYLVLAVAAVSIGLDKEDWLTFGIKKPFISPGLTIIALIFLVFFAFRAQNPDMPALNADEMQRMFHNDNIFNLGIKVQAIGGFLKGSWLSVMIAAFVFLGCSFAFRVIRNSKLIRYPIQLRSKGRNMVRVLMAIALPLAGLLIVGPLYKQIAYGGDNLWSVLLRRNVIAEYIPGENASLWQPLAFSYSAVFFGVLFGNAWYAITLAEKSAKPLFSLGIYLGSAVLMTVCAFLVRPVLSLILPFTILLELAVPVSLFIFIFGSGSGETSNLVRDATHQPYLGPYDVNRVDRIVSKIQHDGTAKYLDTEDYEYFRQQLEVNKISNEQITHLVDSMGNGANSCADDEIRDKYDKLAAMGYAPEREES